MRTVILARAVAVAALLAASGSAAAEPLDLVDQTTCVDGAACAQVAAAAPGTVSAAVTGTPCLDRATSGVCVPEAGAGTDLGVAGAGPLPRGGFHPLTARCSWSGTPGSRVDFGGVAVPGPHPGGTVTSVAIRCTLYVNGQYWSHADGVRWRDESWAHRTTFPPRGARLKVCLSGATARWSDGHATAVAGANCMDVTHS
jgi:hypothetical protein